MSEKQVEIWYDEEADYLEVLFDFKAECFEETTDDRVMKIVDTEGNILGFSVLGVRSIKGTPLKITLASGEAEDGPAN